MKKVKLLLPLSFILISLVVTCIYFNTNVDTKNQAKKEFIPEKKKEKKKKKTMEERRRFAEERWKHEFNLQVNPATGIIPVEEKRKEIVVANDLRIQSKNSKSNSSSASYISRGPSNLGGRTRSLVVDRSDATSNTIIAGGVSSGVFRTTDGGASWTKVSANNEIHNVTTIVQDPRTGFENIWYYGTGESQGNSAGDDGAFYLGQGIWQSIDSGITWKQIPSTASVQEENDSPFDIMYTIAVHPITGDLYAGAEGAIRRFDGTTWTVELDSGGNFFSDLAITSTGIVYAAFSGSSSTSGGVWRSPNGTDAYTRIGSNTDPGFGASGRTVLAIAPSNENIVYTFFTVSGSLIEAGLWRWNDSSGSWTNFSTRMPDEPGGDSSGNDPIAVQGGYDLVVSVKPDDENFVVIGGTNAYRAANINNFVQFERIGGYRNNAGYALYNLGNGVNHHPDIHALVFDPNNPDILFSGTDGGVHRTDATTATVAWNNLNNNYQTYQFYNVAIDPAAASDIVIGGAQDNGTTAGGTDFGRPDLTSMSAVGSGDGVAVGISRDNACTPFFFGSQGGRIRRDCPVSAVITPTGATSQFVTYFYLDPSNNNALYYAGRQNLYRTTQSSTVTSSDWANLGTMSSATDAGGPSNENMTQFSATWGAYDASTSYLLMGGDSGSLVRLDNPQGAFSLSGTVDITPPLARTEGGRVTGIAVHPTNNDIVIVTYSNYGITNIFVTSNATDAVPNWTVVERNLATFSIRSAAITEIDGETTYFVGTARGLYSSSDPMNTDWEIEAPNQIGFAVVSALAYKPSNNKLLVGTHGNGMYEATISSTLSVNDFNASESTKFIAYPNPATDVINVVIEDSFVTGDLDYKIYSIDGKTLKSGVLNSNKQVNVNGLAKGNYILQLESALKKKSIIISKR